MSNSSEILRREKNEKLNVLLPVRTNFWCQRLTKSGCRLVSIISLGINGMLSGPSLPAFISPNVLQYLVETFAIKPIRTPEDDLKSALKQAILSYTCSK